MYSLIRGGALGGIPRIIPSSGSYTYPLDIQNGTGAWGLVKLRAAYAGNCIKVRRSSDNTDQDIGFSGDDLDTSSLLTFCSGTNGFIHTFYDQTGNSRNLTNTDSGTAGKPQIVTSGALTSTWNGHAVLRFGQSTATVLTATTMTSFISNSEGTVFLGFNASSITANNASPDTNEVIWGDTGRWVESVLASGTPDLKSFGFSSGNHSASQTVATGVNYCHTWQHTGGNIYNYLNSTTPVSTSCGNTGLTSSTLQVGNTSGASYFHGYLPYLLIYSATVTSTTIDDINTAMAAYYGLTWA